MKLKFTHFLAFILLAAAFASCKKTVELPALPKSSITTYKVVNLPDTVIYGAIDQLDKSITVYIPYFYNLTVIDPEIAVSDGASITEKVEPFLISASNVKYTVKGADGTSTTYTVKVVEQNPPSLTINWADAEYTETSPALYLPSILGDFHSSNSGGVKVTITHSKTGKAITLLNPNITPAGNLYSLGAQIPADADTGSYNVRVDFLGNTATLNKPLHIKYIQPGVVMTYQEAKQGDNITFLADQSVFINLKSVKVTVNKDTYDLPIVSYTPQTMTLKIPDNFPVGDYFYTAAFSFDFQGWYTFNRIGMLNVHPK
jgi:hypothetical protein